MKDLGAAHPSRVALIAVFVLCALMIPVDCGAVKEAAGVVKAEEKFKVVQDKNSVREMEVMMFLHRQSLIGSGQWKEIR